ncbi:hypothetical protein ATE84_3699 [Aquimarina sp. MAR_2010_214]|nr:hypothetical protein ATE84_3699 [Aquimarina sp. MAR_2010_214]
MLISSIKKAYLFIVFNKLLHFRGDLTIFYYEKPILRLLLDLHPVIDNLISRIY